MLDPEFQIGICLRIVNRCPLNSLSVYRYLKAKRKQTFISIITFISMGGVALGVMALIVVLAVMSGFENDLKNKILGLNSHALVLSWDNTMENYSQVAGRWNRFPGLPRPPPLS